MGFLAADLVNGQIVITSDYESALTATLQCGYGPYLTVLGVSSCCVSWRAPCSLMQDTMDPPTSEYPYLTAVALYSATLETGSSNWAFLSTCRCHVLDHRALTNLRISSAR